MSAFQPDALEVTRRKYRFRLLDAGPSRVYEFVLSNGQPFVRGPRVPRLSRWPRRKVQPQPLDAPCDYAKMSEIASATSGNA